MKSERGGFRMKRQEQRLEAPRQDSYREARKPPSPARCRGCGAVYQRGRWTWQRAAAAAQPTWCPACRRVREDAPAGYVRIGGDFAREHLAEIRRRVRSCEAAEKREHPLQRIMAVRAEAQGLVVTTTDGHLARRIGEALASAFKGRATYRYARGENLLRVTWRR